MPVLGFYFAMSHSFCLSLFEETRRRNAYFLFDIVRKDVFPKLNGK